MTSRADDLTRLSAENASLREQVQLLVRTEQQLYHSQRDLDRQLTRIRSLGQFALGCSSLELPTSILSRFLELIRESFHIEHALAYLYHPSSGNYHASSGAAAEPELVDWVKGLPGIRLAGDGELSGALARVFERASPALTDSESGGVDAWVCIPLKIQEGELWGFVLGWKQARTAPSFHRERMGPEHRPFLELMASHLERAFQNAMLATDLREQGDQLAHSNQKLSSSLTELERAQQRLLQSSKMEAIGRLAGGIAHDFNNLLTVIMSHAEQIQDALPSGSQLHEDVNRIAEASERATTITRQLLAFSRREPRRPELLDLNALTLSMTRMLERVIGSHVELDLDLRPDLDAILADRTQCEQILLNLVLNARDAMPAGGTVRIQSRPADQEDARRVAELLDPARFSAMSVGDTGEGMDEETRAHAFEPFFTTKSVGRGTGLGLAMVDGAMHQNQGHITVSSTPGQGSTFTLYFPRAETGCSIPEPEPGPAAVEQVPAATILFVEDEAGVRTVTRRRLEKLGHRVLEAPDANAAVEIFLRARASIDLLLTDVVMPGDGGVKLAQRLRALEPELPVIFLSGYPFEKFENAEFTSMGRFLQKPFTRDALAAEISAALQGSAQPLDRPAEP